MKKLNAIALGLSMGIVFAVFFFLIVLLAIYANWGNDFVKLLSSIYFGVDASLKGAFIVIPWAFADAFIGGFLIAWLYNKFA